MTSRPEHRWVSPSPGTRSGCSARPARNSRAPSGPRWPTAGIWRYAATRIDFAAEKCLAALLAEAARERVLASAHDLSDGGLAQALVESCLRRGFGAEVDLGGGDPTVELYAESTARVLVSLPGERVGELRALAEKHDVPPRRLGSVARNGEEAALRIEGQVTISLAKLREVRSVERDGHPQRAGHPGRRPRGGAVWFAVGQGGRDPRVRARLFHLCQADFSVALARLDDTSFAPPSGGWKPGTQYGVWVETTDGILLWKANFTPSKAAVREGHTPKDTNANQDTKAKKNTRANKDNKGGLARTGV